MRFNRTLLLSITLSLFIPVFAQEEQAADSTVDMPADTAVVDAPAMEAEKTRGNAHSRQLMLDEVAEEVDGKLQEIEEDGHELNLEDPDDFSSFDVLDSVAERYRFIFTGEDHRVATLNTVLETKMMRYLNTKGYRYYFIEAGEATAQFVNRYIVDEDTAAERILRNYFNPSFFRMFRWLKEANEGKAPEKKIRAVGLDIERNVPLGLRLLSSMLPDKQTPDSLELFTESLRILTGIHEAKGSEVYKEPEELDEMFNFGDEQDWEDEEDGEGKNRYFYFSSYQSVLELTKEFRRKETLFKAYLGEQFIEFEKIVKELENWEVWINYEKKEMPQSWVYRELYMETRFKQFLNDHPGAKGFGQFGRCHVTRITKVGDCGFAFFSSFNKRLITKTPELKDSILSIGIFYAGLEAPGQFFDNGNIVDFMNRSKEGAATLYTGIGNYAKEDLANKFSFVIVAKSNGAGTIRKRKNKGGKDKYYADDNEGMGFTFGSYTHLYDLGGLNTKLQSNFSASPWFQFGIFNSIDRLYLGMDFAWNSSQTNNLGDTLSQAFKGFAYTYRIGGDLAKSHAFEFIPSIGFSYQVMNYSEVRKGASTLLSEETWIEYSNPAFVLDFQAQMGYTGRIISLYATGGYRLDLSNPRWKINDERVQDAPNNKWSGLTFGGGIRLTIPD